jgi:cytochrome P450
MQPAIERMLRRWKGLARSGQSFDVTNEMMRLTLSNAGRTLVRPRLGRPSRQDRARFNFRARLRHAGPRRTFSASQRNQFRYAKRGLNLQIKRIVEKRRAAQRAGEDSHNDLLSILLSMRDVSEEHISIHQLHDEMMTFIFTGHETTAIALAWTWYLLSLHPECESRLYDEVNRVLNGRAPTAEDLPNLPYTRMVFQEALRLYPPVWGIARQTTQDEEIGGYHIPAKSTLSVLPFITHRHPEFWPNPEAFDPQRFTPEVAATRPRYAYLPFGGGVRQCIGNHFAMTEAQLIIASVVQRFRLHLVPGQTIDPMPSTTLRPRHGIWMTLHAR